MAPLRFVLLVSLSLGCSAGGGVPVGDASPAPEDFESCGYTGLWDWEEGTAACLTQWNCPDAVDRTQRCAGPDPQGVLDCTCMQDGIEIARFTLRAGCDARPGDIWTRCGW